MYHLANPSSVGLALGRTGGHAQSCTLTHQVGYAPIVGTIPLICMKENFAAEDASGATEVKEIKTDRQNDQKLLQL